MATIKTVAAVAGVSISTVSNVITGNRPVHPETAMRVRQAMETLAFAPNGIASSLRSKRTKTIGLIVSDITNPFFATLSYEIEQASAAFGLSLMLCNAQGSPDLAAASIRLFVEKRVDGIISAAPGAAPMLDPVVEAVVPLVMVDSEIPDARADVLTVDHHGGGELAARHLLALGHRSIACIADHYPHVHSQGRLVGFLSGLHQADVALRDDHIASAQLDAAGGYEAMWALLQRDPSITAVFAVNDQLALGALKACQDRQFRVPDRISVLGFDDVSLASLSTPRLTTIRQPVAELGRGAVDALVTRMSEPECPVQRLLLPVELVIRESTGPLSPERLEVMREHGS